MIIRLTQKLAKRVKVGTLGSLPPHENPYADWSAHLFTADRTPYIMLTNTQSLYSLVMYAKGSTNDSKFIERALSNIREFMEADGQAFVYKRFITPETERVRFAKPLNRSVTGSMNNLIGLAEHQLTMMDRAPLDVGFNLNEIPMSATGYRSPLAAFKQLGDARGTGAAGGESPTPRISAEPTVSDRKLEDESETSSEPAIDVSFTHMQRSIIAELLPPLAIRLRTNEYTPRTISFSPPEIKRILQDAEAAIPIETNGRKRMSLRQIVKRCTAALEGPQGIEAIPKAERLYQFRIELQNTHPPIWRRIQVKDCTLDKLHTYIQTSLGWTNSHLHQFTINDVIHGDPDLLCEGWEDETIPVDSRRTKISKIVPKDGSRYRFQYEYDFGDGWQHEVLFEGCLRATKGQRYPLCLEGERACPPEDVGGAWGYAEFLKIMADPDHEQHDEFVEWSGQFDAEQFDAEKATKSMRRGLPEWREYD